MVSYVLIVLQRLSASVRKVSKGVLKEHIILVANNMTCSGDMLGFNSGGYKALTRSLNIKAPFTEATLIVSLLMLECPITKYFLYWPSILTRVTSYAFRRQGNVSRKQLRNAIKILYQQ